MGGTCSVHVEIRKLYTSLVGDHQPTRSRETCKPSREKNVKINHYIFWDTMPCSELKVNRRFGGAYSSETSFYFQRATRHYIPEDRTLHNHRCENLKSYNIKMDPGKHSERYCHVSGVRVTK
jgi:hypothetical protein